MRNAIKTVYRGATETKPSKIVATCEAGRLSVSYDHALNIEGNHRAAAQALADKLGWCGKLASGALPDCYVHVFVE